MACKPNWDAYRRSAGARESQMKNGIQGGGVNIARVISSV